MNKLFCFGIGYTAQRLISNLSKDPTWQFAGTCRTAEKADALAAQNIEAHLFDFERMMPNPEALFDGVTHLLMSIAPDKNFGDPVLHFFAEHLAKLQNLQWVGYLSTTGVYGDHKGAWVNDDTPTTPSSERGRLRLAAEQGWLKLQQDHGLPVHLFRLGSIYGPGRGQHESLKKGRLKKWINPDQTEQQYFSRIHVDDIVQVLLASMNNSHPGQSYNVVDNEPAPPADVVDYVCDLSNVPRLEPQSLTDENTSPMMRSFYSENKKVANDRICKELGVKLIYPTYREGFRALID